MVQEQGGRSGEPTGQPSAPDGAEPQLPDTPESLILQGIEAGLASLHPEPDDSAPAPAGEPSSEDAPADATAAEAADEEPAPDAEPDAEPTAEAKPKRSPAEWAEVIAREGVQRLAEISPSEHAAVMKSYGEIVARQAASNAERILAENIQRQDQVRTWVGEIDQHFAEDPDGKLAWLESEDPRVDLYRNGKRLIERIAQQTPEERVGELSALNAKAQRQFTRLQRFPDAQRELLQRQQQGRYPADENGVSLLERDVDELFEQGHAQPAQGSDPAAASSEPAPRRRPARPLVGSGVSAGGARPRADAAPDISKINDPSQLFTIGVTDQLKALNGR